MKNKFIKSLLAFSMLFASLAFTADQNGSTKVYICTGEYAYVYHKHKVCRGLKQCREEVKEVSLAEAKKLKREKPCGYCYKK